jgi:cell division protein FtsI (penicillin-binding protein 3)
MALDVGGEKQRAFLKSLGLLDRPNIEIPEVGAPMLPTPWREISTMTVAYGHGIAVSPLQMATAYSIVVNGGFAVAPTLIKRNAGDRMVQPQIISAQTSQSMRELLSLVVEDGTGKQAAAQGYLVGGKTGTAEKAGVGGYRRKALLSSFVAAFPIDDPRYVVFVALDEPKGTKRTFNYATAGWTAAPAAGRIVNRIAPLLGVAPARPPAEVRGESLFVSARQGR